MEVKLAFQNWIERHPEVLEQKNLVAVSGGLDSMTLLHLCNSEGLDVEVCHVNYGLRGEDSDLDEKLVIDFCDEAGLVYHISKWNDDSENGSLQMRCREFRYSEFDRLMKECGLANTLIAHHSDDSVETVLLNLFRGTGLRGLTGITESREGILRPLLECSRSEIEEYASENGVKFREDSSNQTTDYDRNFIRNEVLSLIGSRFPNAGSGILKTSEITRGTYDFVQNQVENIIAECSSGSLDQQLTVDLKSLRAHLHYPFILGEYLSRFDFPRAVTTDIFASDRTGATFKSSSHQVTIDRDRLIIESITSIDSIDVVRFDPENPPTDFIVAKTVRPENWSLDPSPNVGEFDFDKLNPADLQLRSWQVGDRLNPLGMSGWKKLSDLFIDLKVSLNQKGRIPILTSENQIFWVVGLRMDDRFKVTDKTTTILRIEYHR